MHLNFDIEWFLKKELVLNIPKIFEKYPVVFKPKNWMKSGTQ